MRMPDKINNVNTKPVFEQMNQMSLEQKKTAIRFGLEYVKVEREIPLIEKVKFVPKKMSTSIDVSETKK